jgi:glycogen operon protein
VLRQRTFFEDRAAPGGDNRKDLAWFRADGAEMTDADWLSADIVTHGMFLDGRGIRERGPQGERVTDDSYLLVLHSGADDATVTLPGPEWANAYDVVLDTATEDGTTAVHKAAAEFTMTARSLVLLRAILGDDQ